MNLYYPFVNTPLPYPYDGLEPNIDTKTMELHHNRHLQTYIDNLNDLLAKNPQLQSWSLIRLVRDWSRLPKPLQIPIRNNAGGVYNHRFYFEGMSPLGMEQPLSESGRLVREIGRRFGSFGQMKDQLTAAALSVFGSGYAWLVFRGGKLNIVTTPNQDTPLCRGLIPILNVDVWEHAYYLKHYNVRKAYLEDWFGVVNWTQVERRYKEALL